MSVATSDVVVELRRRAASQFWTWSGEAALYGRAADEIERLRAEVGRGRPKEGRPTVVTLCGSTKFRETFERVQREETLAGRIVLSVGMYGHQEGLDMAGAVKAMLDDLHLKKIDRSDEIYVLNCNGYLGESTRREIAYARATGKAIRWLEEPFQEC